MRSIDDLVAEIRERHFAYPPASPADLERARRLGLPDDALRFYEPIPLYLLPLTSSNLQGIAFWAAAYRAHDEIWIQSGTLAMRAYREHADPGSDLAEHGRKACSDIEKATGKPTYYYLHRYYARREGEERRPCPGCGMSWAVRTLDDPGTRFRDFFFRCDRCRLVSRLGDSVEGARLARIGIAHAATGVTQSVRRGRRTPGEGTGPTEEAIASRVRESEGLTVRANAYGRRQRLGKVSCRFAR